jgi:hypothetical protein
VGGRGVMGVEMPKDKTDERQFKINGPALSTDP